MELNQISTEEKELMELTRKRVKKIKDFYIHIFLYSIGAVIFILKTYFSVKFNFFPFRWFPNWFIMSIWTAIIVFQMIELFFAEIIFGKRWENKKIKEIMTKETKKQTWE